MDESISALWLLPDILAKVFYLLGVRDKGRVAQVCRTWRDITYIPSIWRDVQVTKLSPASLVDIYVQRGIRRIQSPTSPTDAWIQDLNHFLSHCKRTVPIDCIDLSECICLTYGQAAELMKMTLKSLRTLNISYCSQLPVNFIEVIVDECPNLEELQLEACFQSDQPLDGHYVWNQVSKLRRLKHLDLTACPVDDDFVECLADTDRRGEVVKRQSVAGGDARCSETVVVGQLTSLVCLNLSWCDALTDVSLRYISHFLPHLKSLSLAHCNRVTCDGMSDLSRMSCLRRLTLPCLRRRRLYGLVRHGVEDNDHGMRLLATSGVLKRLDLLSVVGISDKSMGYIASCTHPSETSTAGRLKTLELRHSVITDQGLTSLIDASSATSSLEKLTLICCTGLTGSGFDELATSGQLAHLKHLNLKGCVQLTDDTFVYIANAFSRLRSLVIDSCSVSDKGLRYLATGCPLLTSLDISCCKLISDDGLTEVARHLHLLEHINLEGQDSKLVVAGDGFKSLLNLRRLRTVGLTKYEHHSGSALSFVQVANCVVNVVNNNLEDF